ncbi:CB5D1 protein, partial [Crocuta crocuta]
VPRRGLVAGPDFEVFRRRYFTPAEVAQHNRPEDLWVSYLGHVYDLTQLAQECKGRGRAQGQGVRGGRAVPDPLTGTLRYRTPRGRFLHVPPQLPRSDWANDFGKPWWRESRYEVGRLSAKTRTIRIVNTLTSQEHTLEVGALESMWEILHRYLPYNAHAASYTWKYEGKNLNMNYTLEENGIRNEDEEFDYLKMDGALYTPAILLYFNDDLTEV